MALSQEPPGKPTSTASWQADLESAVWRLLLKVLLLCSHGAGLRPCTGLELLLCLLPAVGLTQLPGPPGPLLPVGVGSVYQSHL